MINLLKKLHDRFEQMSGRKIFVIFTAIFIVFLGLGIIIGNAIKPKLKEDEVLKIDENVRVQEKQRFYEGKIEYLNPSFNPNDNISYVLVDGSGKQIILLKSKDQKLNIAEGMFVKVKGVMTRTKDGKSEVLNVTEVIIKNAAN